MVSECRRSNITFISIINIQLALSAFLRLTRNRIPYCVLHTIQPLIPPGPTTLGARGNCGRAISSLLAQKNISALSPLFLNLTFC